MFFILGGVIGFIGALIGAITLAEWIKEADYREQHNIKGKFVPSLKIKLMSYANLYPK